MADYGRRIVIDAAFERVLPEAADAFSAEGFDLLSTVDIGEYLSRRARHECRRYVLMSAYLPHLLLEALQHDPEAGLLMPISVAVFELPDGETAVTASPALKGLVSDLGWRLEKPELAAIADRAAEHVARAIDRLRVIARREKVADRPDARPTLSQAATSAIG